MRIMHFAGGTTGTSSTNGKRQATDKTTEQSKASQSSGRKSPSPVDRDLFDPNKTVQDQKYYDKLHPNKGSYGDWKDLFGPKK